MTKIVLAFVAMMGLVAAQESAPAGEKKDARVAKDQQEADLINSLPKEPDPAKRLQILDKWKQGYPDSPFAPEREQAYLDTYQQLKKPREAVEAANEILKRNANDFTALRSILVNVFMIGNPPPAADLDAAEKVASHFVNDADSIFTDANKPAYMNADQWKQSKDPMRVFSQRIIGVIYVTKKDFPRAETELTKALQMSPNDAQLDQMLGQAILAQNKEHPEKQPMALFYYARAAAFDGQGALPAQTRQQIQRSVGNMYNQYHGGSDGFDKLLAVAKANPAPPADFHLDSVSDVAAAKAKADEDAAKANPTLAVWKTIKDGLTGANADQFFESSVKDAELPPEGRKFKGKLIKAIPELRPKELVLAIEKADVADCTIKLAEGTFAGKMDPGGDIEFVGVAKSYTKEPYMLTLEVEREKVSGWTGKNVPAAKKSGTTAKKKAQ